MNQNQKQNQDKPSFEPRNRRQYLQDQLRFKMKYGTAFMADLSYREKGSNIIQTMLIVVLDGKRMRRIINLEFDTPIAAIRYSQGCKMVMTDDWDQFRYQ